MRHLYKILYGLFLLVLIGFSSTLEVHQTKLTEENGAAKIDYLEGQIVDLQENIFTVKGKTGQEIVFEADMDFLFNPYKKGDVVTLYKIENPEDVIYDIVDYVHFDGIIFFFICFVIITIWIAKRKGFFSIVSLLVSTSLFYFIFLRALESGYSPIFACLLFVLGVTFITIPLIHGFNRKSGSSLIAINVGFLMSFLISLVFKNLVRLGNVPSEALRNLSFQLPELDMGGLLMVILFMGAVGALIDVAVTISSAVFEASKTQQKISFKASYELGMEVGKDILGSMINTLLLAYLASSIPFFILLTYAKSTTFSELLNIDFVALEITRTLIGAMSLILLVPLSAVVSSWMLSKKK